jgi:tripartite-type tricarboxylate transporter receptor subunit TctC
MVMLSRDYIYAAPPGLPADIYKVLNEAMEKTLRDPAFGEEIKKAKLSVDLLSSEEVRKRISRLSNILPQYKDVLRQALGK